MKKIVWIVLSVVVLTACNQPAGNESSDVAETTEQKNEVVENILNRRSIRSYTAEQITQEQLDIIIQCAMNAPSAMNKQPWEVRVVQDQEVLKQINDRFVKNANREPKEGFSVFYNAPTLIVIAREKENSYSASDCGMLAQNILLSAESMNIGTCVIGGVAAAFKGEGANELMEALQLPATHEVIYGIATGYKNESPEAKPRDMNKVQYIR
ncbi:MAG: nitroreductase family protein [Candidatus Azobacteroides sp.]|nr:nitroreductase family protein [Candidatus Azobacteroides sp.]